MSTTDHDHALAPGELELCAEQLWPGLQGSQYSVVTTPTAPLGWATVDQHRIIGRRDRADMVLPMERVVAARALAEYPGLRPLRPRWVRRSLAAGIATGLAGPVRTISLLRPDGGGSTSADTVLDHLRRDIDPRIAVTMHVRRSANRKALLQVVGHRGQTLGFAKLARNEVSAIGIRNEIVALRERNGGNELVRVPRVLTAAEHGELPYLVSEPLPRRIRGLTPTIADTPSVGEFAEIAPVTRWATASETGHARGLRDRSAALPSSPKSDSARTRLSELLTVIEEDLHRMPVSKEAHGDFAFWNTGRTPDGTLWCWDFENVASDALTGLDILHWHASRRRLRRGAAGVGDREGILADSAAALTAFGVSEPARAVLWAVYIADIAIRTLETAADDGWTRVWAQPGEVQGLIERAIVANGQMPRPIR